MKIILLDGDKIKNISDFYNAFYTVLDTDGRCGKSLDALHDILTDVQNEVGIIAVNTDKLYEAHDKKRNSFLRLMTDLSGKNRNIHFTASPFYM